MTENKAQDLNQNAGNIWSKKFNFWATIFFIALILLAVYRHFSMDVPFGGEGEVTEMEGVDSLKVPNDKTQNSNSE